MSSSKRLASLDALRGFAIAAMMLVNNPGSWDHVYGPLDHSVWNGCTFTDLVFPFFLFAAGLAMTLSLGNRAGLGASSARSNGSRLAVYGGILRRAGTLFLIGFLFALVPGFHFSTVRILGVLQRIALTIGLAAPVVLWGRWRAAVLAIAALFGIYLVLMLAVPVPGTDGLVAAGRLQPGQDFGAWLDRLVLGGHLWAHARTWDPEGLVSTLPAAGSLLFGVLAGHYLAAPAPGIPTPGVPTRRLPKSVGLLLAGLVFLGVGAALGAWFIPLNKSLWTPSFAIFTAGWALVFLGVFHGLLDEAPASVREPARKLFLPLTIYGMNALFLFVVSGVVARILQGVPAGGGLTLKEKAFQLLATLPLAPVNASLLFAVLFDLAMFAVAWGMWRKRWFVKA